MSHASSQKGAKMILPHGDSSSGGEGGSSDPQQVRRNKPTSPVLVMVGLCCLASAAFNIMHAQWWHISSTTSYYHWHSSRQNKRYDRKHIFHSGGGASSIAHPSAIHLAMHQFMQGKHQQQQPPQGRPVEPPPPPAAPRIPQASDPLIPPQSNMVENKLATLSCTAHGGPHTPEETQEMVYWHDIPSDAMYSSPRASNDKEKYLTFEPDGGGWNNIRMAMETVIGLAIATGRTLVLPAQQRMYLLGKDQGKQRTEFDFDHFFPIYEMAAENNGLNVISMEEFLQRVAMQGKLENKVTGVVEFPPHNRTNWNGQNGKKMEALKDYLRNHTHTPKWLPGKCMAAFAKDSSEEAVERLNGYLKDVVAHPLVNPKLDHPPSVASIAPVDRLRENMSGRRNLCVYTPEVQDELVLHFMCSHKLGYRMLVHFYAFLYFEDWREDLWMKRFMRDHIRYKDPIQCAAARIVVALRKEFGDFDTFHIRRGDFQFKKTRIEATDIFANVKDTLPEGRPVFIATDERDKKFFDPLKEHYQVRFLDDYKHLLDGVNTNFYGMIDQLVASRGTRFFGCWQSTFTGFIMRMRGYHASNHKQEGYEDGRLPHSFYYVPLDYKKTMDTYAAIHRAFFNREFPTSWRDLDASVGDIPGVTSEEAAAAALAVA